jgi:WD40 repeat protein
VVCLREENRVVIHDLDTKDWKARRINQPWTCASSQHLLAIPSNGAGMNLFTTDGVLVHTISEAKISNCVAFHPDNTNILAIGFKDGSVRTWDIFAQTYVSEFKESTYGITKIRFAPDFRLFLSSWDNAASIVALDDQLQIMSSVKLEGHTSWVYDILALPSSNLCVTCSHDQTIKVWDCQTGACLRTLTEHTNDVSTLVLHPSGQHFASGSHDKSVIVWSCETFEVTCRFPFLSWVHSLVFVENVLF